MHILMIESSPHKNGSSNLLAAEWMWGARDAGHKVEVFDAGHAQLHPCLGCEHCGMDGPCCQRDDMAALREQLLTADMAVFVTPLYYFGVSAQLKMVIDRFYSFTTRLSGRRLKTALIAAAWDSNDWTMTSIQQYYETLCRYLHFRDQGSLLGTDCGTPAMTRSGVWPQRAYDFGRSM